MPGSGERTVRSAIVDLLWLGKGGAHGIEAGAPLGAGLQRLLDADCAEVGLAVGLRLRASTSRSTLMTVPIVT